MRYAVMLLIVAIAFEGCAPKVKTQTTKSYSSLDDLEEVIVFGLDENIPDDAEELGSVEVGDTGFTLECTFEIVLEKAKIQARKAGGNALLITDHKLPSAFGSSCHRIKATIFRIPNAERLTVKDDNVIDDKSVALLHIYRFGGMGSLVGYNLYLGDSLICRVKNNWKETIVIKQSGSNTIWAKTEAKTEIPIEIELGREYYVRCGISMGAFVGHPTLGLVGSTIGRTEFDKIKGK